MVDPADVSTDQTLRIGLTVAGFAVTQLEPPHLVVLRGRHRFSRYAIVLTLEPHAAGRWPVREVLDRVRREALAEYQGASAPE